MQQIKQKLKNSIEGEVRFDLATRRAYSVDASIYEIEPIGVVFPKHTADILAVISIAGEFHLPLISRGAATGITGGCIGTGLIIDFSKYFNQIIEINFEQEYAICQPGVIQDQLNAQLCQRGYRLGPDTSTGNRATLGGMLANNAAGSRSLRYGKMVDHILEVSMALSSGELIHLKNLSEEAMQSISQHATQEGQIYKEVLQIREEYRQEIERRFPKIPRRVSGYNLDELLTANGLNLSKLIAGSEGTLGMIVEMKVKISRMPKVTGLSVIHCAELLPAMQFIPKMLSHQLLSLELIDHRIIEAGSNHPSMKGKLDWLVGSPQAVYIAELEGEDTSSLLSQLKAFNQTVQALGVSYAIVEAIDAATINAVWELRKAGLGLLLSKRTYSRAIAFIEDVAVPPQEVFGFMREFSECLKRFHKEAGIYGHVGAGCIHVRPYIDLRKDEELQIMQQMMLEVADLLLKHGGTLSGEHGDGYIRSWLNQKMFGEKLYEAFCRLKKAFDPIDLLNPGKVVHPLPLLHDLRSANQNPTPSIQTFLDFGLEGGFELAADLCNGNAACRKKEGVMCPSFQATNDEYDTTRARAQALRAIIHGHWPTKNHSDPLASQPLLDVLDLCLQCKGCKTECPSEVDMAKMKSEVLYHYYEQYGYPLRARLFGHIGKFNQAAAYFARQVNFLMRRPIVKKLLGWLGIAPQRTMPSLALERFSCWFKKHPPKKSDKQVLLFADTFTEFNHPEVGQAAVKVLEALGYSVVTPPWRCCGRTLYSKGLLKEAKNYASKLVNLLKPYVDKNIPIVGLEPSCLFMLSEDFHGLIEDLASVDQIKNLCFIFDEFLFNHLKEGKLPLDLSSDQVNILLHGHCHQKAHADLKKTLILLKSLPGCHVELIDAGCCGMAGSFGFEKEHYSFSMKVGSLKLFPAIRKKSTNHVIIANGISCRQQIGDGTDRKALHLSEFLAARLI